MTKSYDSRAISNLVDDIAVAIGGRVTSNSAINVDVIGCMDQFGLLEMETIARVMVVFDNPYTFSWVRTGRDLEDFGDNEF